ncbi:glycerol uptake facilitator-like aquaporin [Nocardia tenerifensis]|uniref:Glycerol uptake facilitator-like aquaporin n=1 Tax=Nocardia tenerifensis TaxID=228006 RepID=A0A318KLI8_9NOCA|nr:aquaporin [Nocardia tenerifensis]PXX69307.1 glycerol uptake facilitator-like aquaporin [Nocardia tenerifensis]
MATSASTATAPRRNLDAPGRDIARKLAVEGIGTFFLVFTVGAAVHSGSSLAPLAIGAALMVMVYAGGHISGGHYNPAVTLAALVRGRIGAVAAGCYWATQVVAGLVAAVVVRLVIGGASGRALNPSGHPLADALAAELLFTFALAYVVLNVATSADHPNNSFYGLAIGFTVAAGAIAVGGVSGGAFNPAVLFGGMVMGLFGPWTLLYLIVELLAGAAAGLAFRMLNRTDV